jgi:hypothetical protein
MRQSKRLSFILTGEASGATFSLAMPQMRTWSLKLFQVSTTVELVIVLLLWLNNLQGGKVHLDSQFRSMFIDSTAFGPVVRQNILAGAHGGENLPIS